MASAALAAFALMSLPEDVQQKVVSFFSAADLLRAASTHARWQVEAVPRAAEARLRLRRPTTIPAGRGACPCWLRSLVAVERLEAAVGARPRDRTWRDEYPALELAAARREEDFAEFSAEEAEELRASFLPDGNSSLTKMLTLSDWQQLVDDGWAVDDAQAIRTMSDTALNDAIAARDSTFAATAHTIVDAYSNAALRDALRATASASSRAAGTCVPDEVTASTSSHAAAASALERADDAMSRRHYYAPLHSRTNVLREDSSLTGLDAAWRRIETMAVGASFTTSCMTNARPLRPCYFPDDRGMHTEQLDDDDPDAPYQYVLHESPVVRFLSAPPDRAGYHALVRDGVATSDDEESWGAPPFSTFTLVAISEPGEWPVRLDRQQPTTEAISPQQRLFTVRVAFG